MLILRRDEPAAAGARLVLRVVDFGFSQKACTQGYVQRKAGTPLYTAPEVFSGRHGLQADLWGIGVLVRTKDTPSNRCCTPWLACSYLAASEFTLKGVGVGVIRNLLAAF